MKNPNGLYFVSFTPKGYLVNQLLAAGWGWHAAQRHARRLFSADGTEPAPSLSGPELTNVKAYIAACDQLEHDDVPTIWEQGRGCGMCMDSEGKHSRPCSCPCHLGEAAADDYTPRVEQVACGGLEVRA